MEKVERNSRRAGTCSAYLSCWLGLLRPLLLTGHGKGRLTGALVGADTEDPRQGPGEAQTLDSAGASASPRAHRPAPGVSGAGEEVGRHGLIELAICQGQPGTIGVVTHVNPCQT